MELNNKKCLIAFFSHKGYNYLNGSIVNLPIGNTQIMAETIARMTGGDLFEITATAEYPIEYKACTEVAKKEKEANVRPELVVKVENIADYDVVFLGYPNWWGTCPMPVFTFLNTYHLSEVTMIPFCTHEGSGFGVSEQEIKNVMPTVHLLKGLALRGSMVKDAEVEIANWLENLKK